MKNFLNRIVSHVYRESNRCADSLPKMRVVQDTISIFCMTCPHGGLTFDKTEFDF